MLEINILSMICMMVKCYTCSHSIHSITENINRFFSANVQGEKEYRTEITNVSY